MTDDELVTELEALAEEWRDRANGSKYTYAGAAFRDAADDLQEVLEQYE